MSYWTAPLSKLQFCKRLLFHWSWRWWCDGPLPWLNFFNYQTCRSGPPLCPNSKGVSYCKAKTTFTFHACILTLSNALLSINNSKMKSESGFSLATASLPFCKRLLPHWSWRWWCDGGWSPPLPWLRIFNYPTCPDGTPLCQRSNLFSEITESLLSPPSRWRDVWTAVSQVDTKY